MGIKLIDRDGKKYRIAFWYKNRHFTKVVYGNKRLAEEVEAKMRLELAGDRYFPERQKPSMSVTQAVDLFFKRYAVHKLSGPSFYRSYCAHIKNYFGAKLIAEVNPEDVRQFRYHLRSKKGLAVTSVNHGQRVLRCLFNWLKTAGHFNGENPASGSKVKMENERKYWRREYLTREQLATLVSVAAPSLKPIILTAAFTGMRRKEIKGMRKKDVDLDRCVIFIPDSKTQEPGYVPISDSLFKVLEPMATALLTPESPIFDFMNFRKLWDQAKKRAELNHIHFHDLRHTAASHALMATGDLAAVKALLRLKTAALVDRYAHLSPNHMRQVALALDKRLSPPQENQEDQFETNPIINPITMVSNVL